MCWPAVRAFLFAYCRLAVRGWERVPRQGPVLIAANHVSGFDPVALAAALAKAGRHPRFLASDWLFDHPWAGFWVRVARQIPIRKGAGPQQVEAALDALAAGECVVVYPEGGIPKSEVRSGRPGAGLLALRCPGPVLPARTDGMDQQRRWRPWRRRRVTVTVGPPVALPEVSDDRDGWIAAADALLAGIRRL